MKIRLFALSILCALAAVSCDAVKQAGSSYLNMVNCKYEYRSITGLSVGGVNVSQGLSPVNIVAVTALLSGRTASIPLDMTLNLDVTNPNQTAAMLSGMQYILSIDGVEFTTGSAAQSFSVAPGATGVLPLTMGFDIARLMSGESKDAALNAVKNFVGIGERKSSVSLQIRPSFLVNGYPVASPVYLPVEFSFGGK